jgi:hypothetical protein
VVLVLLVACAPDTSNTAFLCDESHACPTGQTCTGGRCRRGSGGDGVACMGATCSPEQQCCVDGVNAPRCIPAGDTCAGSGALCDGLEDCQSGDFCCSDTLTRCEPQCTFDAVCLQGSDCPSASPNCCFGSDVPWGTCSDLPCS